MKKVYAVAAAVLMMLTVPVTANASDGIFNFGVKAGLNFTNMSGFKDIAQEGFLETYTGFNAGVVLNFNLPLGFELNPEILYVQSGQRFTYNSFYEGDILMGRVSSVYRSGSVRVPVNIQWGIGLFNDFIKPYLMVSPYVGAVVFGDGSILDVDLDSESVNSYLNRFQYGIGVGAGIYIWNFQISFKWNWDLNPTFKGDSGIISDILETKDKKFNGGELSLAFFF